MSVRAAATATSTTAMPAAPIERNVGSSRTSSPHSETATVTPEKATVRPAVADVRTTASATARPPARSSRKRLTMSSP